MLYVVQTIPVCTSALKGGAHDMRRNFFFGFFFNQIFSSKQSLVIAGLGDLSRPADQLSIGQSASLFATGVIWSRYSLVIIPKNYGLFSVNVFVALVQLVQLTRAYNHSKLQKSAEKSSEAPPQTPSTAVATTKN